MEDVFYEEIIHLILEKRMQREELIENMPEGEGKKVAREMESIMQSKEDRGIAALRDD